MLILPTKDEFVRRALAALDANELQCQRPDFDKDGNECIYSGPCVVGAVFSPAEREYLDDLPVVKIESLVTSGYVHLPPDDSITLPWLCDLQQAHDNGDVDELRELLSE